MWEEDPRYQQAAFLATAALLVGGTIVLAGLAWFTGDFDDLRAWAAVIGGFLAAWLIVVGCVSIVVRLVRRPSRRDRRHD